MIFQIKIHTYPFILIFCLDEEDDVLEKTLSKYNIKCKEECSLRNYEGFYIPFDNGVGLIRMRQVPKTKRQVSVLSHECLHATFDILRQVGVKLTEKSEEAYTYLQEYIFYKALKKIKWIK